MTAAFRIPFPVRSTDRLCVEAFLAFLDERPEKERWQLIDGYAVMMAPASLRHQRIGYNILRLLNDALEDRRPDLVALPDIGLIIPMRPDFRPQPDVCVVGADGDEAAWQDQFYLAAEILSDGNSEEYIAEKRECYAQHPDNLYILIVEQRKARVELFSRANGWRPQAFDRMDDVIELSEFGLRCRLSDIYRRVAFG
jgi:Uma2 family endonuclease